MGASCIASPIDTVSPRSDVSREEALFLRRIADFWEEGEVQIAKAQMEGFLGQFAVSPYSDTLRMTLGDLLLREKNFQDALQYYAQITSPKLENQVFLRRMECLYHLEWHATLADECEAYLQSSSESKTEADRLEVMTLFTMALYEQCLTGSKEEAVLQTLAERAKPYFSTLSSAEVSVEVLSALAHLQIILKDFASASQLYLDLASSREEFAFQAALSQAKYDKQLALTTFQKIGEESKQFQAEATYNQLVLLFDLGRYEEIVEKENHWAQTVVPSKKAIAHLLVGQSYLRMNRSEDATRVFNAFLDLDIPFESIRIGLLQFLDVAYHTNNITLLDRVLAKWQEADPEDLHLAEILLARAHLLKKSSRTEDAKSEIQTLITRFPAFHKRREATFMLVELASLERNSVRVREAAKQFLQEYPSDELAPTAWRHVIAASVALSVQSTELKMQLIKDIQECLAHGDFLSVAENGDLQFRLAKAHFEMGTISEALEILQPLCNTESGILFSEQPNAELLLALCYRDSQTNHALFCQWAESALAHDATLMPKAEQHLALFNSYLIDQPMATDLLAHHLAESLSLESKIGIANLLWLANHAFTHMSSADIQKIIPRILVRSEVNAQHLTEETLPFESVIVQYAKLFQNQDLKGAFFWLDSLSAQYQVAPELPWTCVSEARLTLAEWLLAMGSVQQAEDLFENVAGSTILRDPFAAKAALQSARLKQKAKEPDQTQILSLLKNIVLQKTVLNEPTHLEAAFDYIELSAGSQTEKKLDLLLKTKVDFESKEDLLSLDYHAAREKNATQNQIYLNYMRYLDAKILLTKAALAQDLEQQKELKANAKEFLLQITGNTSPDLQRRLDELEGVWIQR
jgi:hypothetical protein